MEAECSNDGDNGIPRLRSSQAPRNATAVSAAAVEETTPNAAAEALFLGPDNNTQRQKHERSTRRSLRWALPAEGDNNDSTIGILTNPDGDARHHGPPAGSPAPAGSKPSTAPRRSSLRRAVSSSPPPSLSSSQQLQSGDGLRRRHSTRPRGSGGDGAGRGVGSGQSPEMFSRRHSASVGPAIRYSRSRLGEAAAAAGERRLEAFWERERRRRSRRPGRLCAAAVARHAAQHALEDLLSSSHARNGVLLLAGAFVVSCGRTALSMALWCVVLATGGILWVRSAPARSTLPSSSPRPATCSGPGVPARLWEAVAAGEELKGERVEPLFERFSAAGWRDAVVVVALVPWALDAAAVYCFFRLAARTGGFWLSLGLAFAPAAYTCSVGVLIVAKGANELRRGEVKVHLWRLMGLWHALLMLPAAAALSRRLWDGPVARQGLGSTLLTLAAWQLGNVSAERVELAVRRGLEGTLDRALKGAVDHELSTTSLLELSLARWLADYWSLPPTFSSAELREKLVHALSSVTEDVPPVTRDGLLENGDDDGEGHVPGVGVGGSSASRIMEGAESSPPPPPPPPAAVESLTAWLEGRANEKLSVTMRSEREPETPSSFPAPGWICMAPEALLLVRVCPTLCASGLLLCRALTGVPWTEWACLVALVGPAAVEAVEAWKMWVSRRKLLHREREENSVPRPSPPPQAGIITADGLSQFLQESNPALCKVLRNALRAAEKLREGPPNAEKPTLNGVDLSSGAATGMPEPPPPSPFHDKEEAFFSRQEFAARIRTDRILLSRPRRLKEYLSYSRPRSADSPAYPGRFTGSRTNNSLGPGPSRPLVVSSGARSATAAATAPASVAAAVAPAAHPAPIVAASGVGFDVGVDIDAAAGVGFGAREGDRQARASSTPDLLAAAAVAPEGEGVEPRGEEPRTIRPAADDDGDASAADAAADAAIAAEDTEEQNATAPTTNGSLSTPTSAAPAAVSAAAAAEAAGDDWDLFGTTWAGVVVGAAGDLAGVVGEVAGGAIGSVPVLGGVLEWWGVGGGGQQERSEAGDGGGAAENDGNKGRGKDVNALVVGGEGSQDGGGGGGSGGGDDGVELSGDKPGAAEKGGESAQQEQAGSVAEETSTVVVGGAIGVLRGCPTDQGPDEDVQGVVDPRVEDDDGDGDGDGGDDGGRYEKNRQAPCNNEEPTESPSPLYTITDLGSNEVLAAESPVDISTGKQEQQQQQLGPVDPGAETPLSARSEDGGAHEALECEIASMPAGLAQEEKEKVETPQAAESEAIHVGPQAPGTGSEGNSPEAGSGQLNLTGLAWWTVSRAAEFAGGAAYIFLPNFQDGKGADGERGEGGEVGDRGGNAVVQASSGGDASGPAGDGSTTEIGDVGYSGDRSKGCIENSGGLAVSEGHELKLSARGGDGGGNGNGRLDSCAAGDGEK
eukprot:g9653.t1